MVKKTPPQLTFIAQAEIQVQETSPKEKKRKRNVNDVPNGKNTQHPAYLHSQRQNSSPRSITKKKKSKGTSITFPMAKKNTIPTYQAEIQVQEASPKEKKRKR